MQKREFRCRNTDLVIIKAELELPERYTGKIPIGLPVTLSVTSKSDSIRGEIVAVDNREGKFQPSLFCSALFNLPTHKVQIAIPDAALSGDESRSTVWIVKNNKVFKKFINAGELTDGWIKILEGLQPGDLVVTEGAGGLLEDMPVIFTNQSSCGIAGHIIIVARFPELFEKACTILLYGALC